MDSSPVILLTNVDVPLHGLLYVFPGGVVVAVKNADAVRADDVAALEAVHTDTLINHGALFFHGHRRIGQLRNTSRVHCHIFICGQFLPNALRRQNGSLAQHSIYRGNSVPVVERDTD